jgi:hypothetical protein
MPIFFYKTDDYFKSSYRQGLRCGSFFGADNFTISKTNLPVLENGAIITDNKPGLPIALKNEGRPAFLVGACS